MSRGGTTLYVTGFGSGTRARDLGKAFITQEKVKFKADIYIVAYEFERLVKTNTR
jgi:hypothetical protein